jgi:phosphonopyruvate decarboxylase
MLPVGYFVACLKNEGIEFFTGVPDTLLKDLCTYFQENVPRNEHVITANEGNAIALAAGRYVATGRPSLVYMQNSGLGNAVNPLTSLADPEVYSIPMLLLIGWRGEPGVKDEPQHLKQGRITLDLLETMEIPCWILDRDSNSRSVVAEACSAMRRGQAPVAIVVRENTFENYPRPAELPARYVLRREVAIQRIVERLHKQDIIISTTGHISRELYEIRTMIGCDTALDFLTVGSMGHTASIALGLALGRPDRRIFCLDGDGSAIMHMGMLPVIGALGVPNLTHIVLNNGVHGSVGGQPTAGFYCDLRAMAQASGYREAIYAETAEHIDAAINRANAERGPIFIEVRVQHGARNNLARPRMTPLENRNALMRQLETLQA